VLHICGSTGKETKLNAERQCDYRKRKAQENKTQAGNSRAAYMREYRKRMLVEKVVCNNVPKRL
jgi:hypothetical protein